MIRYFAAVAVGFVVDYTIFAGLVLGGLSVYLANVVAFVIGSTVNLLLIRHHVFPAARFGLGIDLVFTLAANGLVLGSSMVFLWVLVAIRINPIPCRMMIRSRQVQVCCLGGEDSRMDSSWVMAKLIMECENLLNLHLRVPGR